jgi:hypothetical protein
MPPMKHRAHQHSVLSAACGLGLLCVAGAGIAAPRDSIGAWREYARRGVMPEYSWNASAPATAPTVLSSLREARASLARPTRSAFTALEFRYSEAPAGYDAASTVAPASGLIARDRSLIRNEFIASTLGHSFGDAGQLELTAIVAHQRYASAGFGTAPWIAQEDLNGLRGERPSEVSAGHGVRVGYRAPLRDGVSLNLSAQSRLDMDAFESYRGVYSEPGDFDLPARLQTQLQWDMTPSASLAFGVERVFYSDVSAFTSANLPTRFLSLLGDGSSPEFAWRDLTVYSLETVLADATGAEWSLRYTTRQQPSPTSSLLDRAMRPDYTDTNLALGYRRELGALGQLWLAASYAPSRYFLGATPYPQRDLQGGSQVEFEALWTVPF